MTCYMIYSLQRTGDYYSMSWYCPFYPWNYPYEYRIKSFCFTCILSLMTIQNPQFKQTYVDFVVEELLPYPLHKHGTRCYVQIEKRNMNTMDLVKKIMQKLNFRRKQLGIAGLKDKHALAKQWICFHNNDIKKYGQKAFLNDLESLTTITNI